MFTNHEPACVILTLFQFLQLATVLILFMESSLLFVSQLHSIFPSYLFFYFYNVFLSHLSFTMSFITIRTTVRSLCVLIVVLTISVNGIYNGFPSHSRSDCTKSTATISPPAVLSIPEKALAEKFIPIHFFINICLQCISLLHWHCGSWEIESGFSSSKIKQLVKALKAYVHKTNMNTKANILLFSTCVKT